jgi:hypothetical protein
MVNITIKRDNKRKAQEVPDEDIYDDQVKEQIDEYMNEPKTEEPAPKPVAKPKGRPPKQTPPPQETEPEPETVEVSLDDLLQTLARIESKVDAVGNISAALYRIVTTSPEPDPAPVVQQVQPIRVTRKEQPLEKKKKGFMGFFGK